MSSVGDHANLNQNEIAADGNCKMNNKLSWHFESIFLARMWKGLDASYDMEEFHCRHVLSGHLFLAPHFV